MADSKAKKHLTDADVFFGAINKYRRNKTFRATFRLILFVLAIVSVLYLLIIYSPLNIFTNLARVIYGNKYLVIFANDAELRPAGGFIGSFAIVDAHRVVPKVLFVETNIYSKDNLFEKKYYVPLPEPLQDNLGKNKSWTLHDSNWDPDFAVSSQYIKWFYEQEYGNDIDGVILVNTKSIQRLLRYTGPIYTAGNDNQLTADNIYRSLGNSVENNYWSDPRNEELNQPKSIIAEYQPVLINKARMLPLRQILQFTRETLQQKEVVVWNNNERIQGIIAREGWSGTVSGNEKFIALINATVGSKTNQNITQSQTINYSTKDNSIEVSEIRSQSAPRDIFGGGENVGFAQVVLPAGSIYKSFTINNIDNLSSVYYAENNRYVSAGKWVKVDTDNPMKIVAEATIPNNLKGPLCVTKQVGSQNAEVVIIIDDVTVYNGMLSTDMCFDKY